MAKPWDRNTGTAFRFLAGPVGLLLLVTTYPLIFAVWTSLHQYSLFAPSRAAFIGLGNYESLLTGRQFLGSVWRTLVFAGGSLVFQVSLGFLLALLLRHDRPGFGLLRVLIVIPVLLTPAVVGLMWFYMYDPNIGVINYAASLLGLPPRAWLSDTNTAMAAVMVTNIWEWTPFAFLVFVAAIKSIPHEIVEAATLDGAGVVAMSRHVFLPLLRPALIVVGLLLAIDNLKAFDLIFVMTSGGPGVSTFTLPIMIWNEGFASYQMGSACAIALFLVAVITLLVAALRSAFREKAA